MNSSGRPITDSPWLWAYLFGTVALLSLAIIGPKYALRQAQVEREFQGRQRVAQVRGGQEPSVEMSSAQRLVIRLQPLFLGLAAISILAWVVFWRLHLSRAAVPSTSNVPGPP